MIIQKSPYLLSEEITVLLHQALRVLPDGNQRQTSRLLDALISRLTAFRAGAAGPSWQRLVAHIQGHHLFALLQEDPFTRRAYEKPRGYAGDAVLLDYIYGSGRYGEALHRTTPTGRRLYNHNRMSPACQAVRNRRDLLGHEIGAQLAYGDAVRILSVAAGHLREAAQVPWAGVSNLDLFLAVDQDPDSLHEINRQGYHPRLQTRTQSIRHILTGKMPEQAFDLIYVAGLYDYLEDRVGARLIEVLFDKLRADGKLLIANFVPTTADAGYMEAFMDWRLIYRDSSELATLAAGLDRELVGEQRTFLDPSGQIAFLELRRA